MPDPTHIDIDYVARLARISLTPEEKETYGHQLHDVLVYFERLGSVDVEGVEPSAHPVEPVKALRADEPGPAFSPEEALANAPAQRSQQIVVPKVVEEA